MPKGLKGFQKNNTLTQERYANGEIFGFQKGHKIKGALDKHWKLPIETKKKHRDASKSYFIKHPEARKKIGDFHRNKIVSEGTKEKLRKKALEQFKNGMPEETKRKMVETFIKHGSNKGKKNGMFGKNKEKSPTWKGGISFEPYGLEFDENLKEVIRNRDRRKCQMCEKTELENNKKLDCHHIDYNKKNNDPQNLISLCRRCHLKTNHNREYWITYFNY